MSVTLFICGDSTAASYPDAQAPLTGWGQALCGLLPGVAIDNRAIAGRSTRTFLNEGRLGAIEPLLKAGDMGGRGACLCRGRRPGVDGNNGSPRNLNGCAVSRNS